MRVPDLLLKSIGFVANVDGRDLSAQSIDPIATAFIVSMPSNLAGGRFYYVITARHVFDGPPVEKVVIVNQKGGGVKPLSVLGPWFGHPDKTVDVVAAQVPFDLAVDVTAFDVEDFFDANNPEDIGPGDEVFFPSLFTPAPGTAKILPLVRYGNLAMLPDQQIQCSDGYSDIYLIEARSIGGISGSPVFVRETIVLPVEKHDKSKVMMHGGGRFKLLGLIKGHWDVDESKINQAYVTHDPKRGVNMGIAQVVPAKKIIETLNAPGLLGLRAMEESKHISSQKSSLDLEVACEMKVKAVELPTN